MNTFQPKTTLGILGGGQLGKMLIQAAIDWDIFVKVMDPDPQAPCSTLADEFVHGSIEDESAVIAFGQDCDVITIEIEHVNTEALSVLQHQGKLVYPGPDIIRMVQNKRLQKQFYQEKGYPTSQFWLVDNRDEVYQYTHQLPLVHKTATAGYDGKGVKVLHQRSDIDQTFDMPGLVEEKVDIQKEISVIVSRNPKGAISVYSPVEMVFHPAGNLVEYLIAPGTLTDTQVSEACQMAQRLIEELDHVGLLAVEMFLDKEDRLLINEIAPRPHNSGHHTIRACMTSQYEQHLRAILGLPPGATDQLIPAAMVNILGDPNLSGSPVYEGIEAVLEIPGAYPFFYGKNESRPFRKMGHVTILDQDTARLKRKIDLVRRSITIVCRGNNR